jgi:hypothetical protein
VTAEVERFCRQAGVRVVRCDRAESLESHMEEIAAM